MDEQSSEGQAAVKRSVDLDTDLETVWQHLTDGRLIGGWMEGKVELDARPGGSIRLEPDEEGPVVWGTVEEVVARRRIQWSWRTDDGLPTQVGIDLDPTATGVRVTVTETLLPWQVSGQGPQWIDPAGPQARSGRTLSLAA